jgi:hypothetical protein
MVLVDRAARVIRNAATGQPMQVPAKRVLNFRVAKAAKDAILGLRSNRLCVGTPVAVGWYDNIERSVS